MEIKKGKFEVTNEGLPLKTGYPERCKVSYNVSPSQSTSFIIEHEDIIDLYNALGRYVFNMGL